VEYFRTALATDLRDSNSLVLRNRIVASNYSFLGTFLIVSDSIRVIVRVTS
jgi:hypothetical protein